MSLRVFTSWEKERERERDRETERECNKEMRTSEFPSKLRKLRNSENSEIQKFR